MAVVYQHKRNDTGEVFYVGIGSTEKRAYAKSKADRTNNHWFHVVNKAGYTVEIIMKDISWNEAQYAERYLIAFYGRRNLGTGSLVNLTDGGDGVCGMKHSEETKRKIGLDNLKPERLKISMKNIKLAHTSEARKKARDNRDYKHIGDVQKLPILQYDKEGLFIKEWLSAKDAVKELKINYESINNCVRNKSKSAGNYVWRYKDPSRWSSPIYIKNIHSEEDKLKWPHKSVIQYDLQGNFIKIWNSASVAARFIDVTSSRLIGCCKGRSKTSKGFIWKYNIKN